MITASPFAPRFDADAFRASHKPELAHPRAEAGKQMKLVDGRCRSCVRGPDNRIVYDSQEQHGEAGLFDRNDAIEHGHSWIEARVKEELRREELEADRRYRLADVEGIIDTEITDLEDRRTAITKGINKARKLRKKLGGEARRPEVTIEFKGLDAGASVFEVYDAPSVFAGTLDVDGNPVDKSTKTITIVKKAEDLPPADAKQVDPATAVRFNWSHGRKPQAEMVRELEQVAEQLDPETLAVLGLGEFGKKKPRKALGEFLRSRKVALDDREAMLSLLDDDNNDSAVAAATLITSTDTKAATLRELVPQIYDMGALSIALSREQSRSSQRKQVVALITEQVNRVRVGEDK